MDETMIILLSFLVSLTTLHQVSTQATISHHGNPCHNVYKNTTVNTPQGKVLCIVPSEEELTEQLSSVGGFNKHYVARTQQEVDENFKNLLPWDGAATTQNMGHPSFRSGKHFNRKRSLKYNNFESKKRKSELFADDELNDGEKRSISTSHGFRRSLHPSGIVASKKMGCIARGQPVGRQKLKQMCDICQRSSELDFDRFPRFVNELTCESAKGIPSNGVDSCFYFSFRIGTCVQSTMTVDLLRRTDKYSKVTPPSGDYFKAYKQVWEPYTQEIRSCCQCRY